MILFMMTCPKNRNMPWFIFKPDHNGTIPCVTTEWYLQEGQIIHKLPVPHISEGCFIAKSSPASPTSLGCILWHNTALEYKGGPNKTWNNTNDPIAPVPNFLKQNLCVMDKAFLTENCVPSEEAQEGRTCWSWLEMIWLAVLLSGGQLEYLCAGWWWWGFVLCLDFCVLASSFAMASSLLELWPRILSRWGMPLWGEGCQPGGIE